MLGVLAEDSAPETDLDQVASVPVAVEDQVGAASSYAPLQEKKQEKRYVGGYGGYAGTGGYGGYGGYGGAAGGYGGYGSGLGAGYGGAYGSGVGVDSYYNPYGSRSLAGLGEEGERGLARIGGEGDSLPVTGN